MLTTWSIIKYSGIYSGYRSEHSDPDHPYNKNDETHTEQTYYKEPLQKA